MDTDYGLQASASEEMLAATLAGSATEASPASRGLPFARSSSLLAVPCALHQVS